VKVTFGWRLNPLFGSVTKAIYAKFLTIESKMGFFLGLPSYLMAFSITVSLDI